MVDGVLSYEMQINGDSEASFINEFERCWQKNLDRSIPFYKNAKILMVGNRIRPRLLAWGYCYNKEISSGINFNEAAELAVAVELIHKATLILDDLIDGDLLRNGEKTFHNEHSSAEAIIFPMFMFSNAMQKIMLHANDFNGSSDHLKYNLHMICDTLNEMCNGALKEISMNKSDYSNIGLINEIISMETISIIKNSILLGYFCSSNVNDTGAEKLREIGTMCGYMFQVLNDMEPFSEGTKILEHKGLANIDILRFRKNIVFAQLYNLVPTEDKYRIMNTASDNELNLLLRKLYQEYNLKELLLNEISSKQAEVYGLCDTLTPKSAQWTIDFKNYISDLLIYCKSRIE